MTTFSIAISLGLVAACSANVAGPGASGPGQPTTNSTPTEGGETAAPAGSSGSVGAREMQWRADAEAMTKQDSRNALYRIKNSCGRGIEVVYDWSTLKMSAFGENRNIAGYELDTLSAIANLCEDSSKAAFQAAGKKIRRVTNRYRACAQLPPAKADSPLNETNTGFDYDVTDNGTNIDIWFCEKSTVWGMWTAGHYLAKKL